MKMTYPGLVLLVGVGVGIATFLYYVFTTENHEEGQRQSYSGNRRSSEDRYEDRSWSITSHRSENIRLSRRSSSNSSKIKEGRDATSKDDINNCSICQYALIDSDVTQLRSCKHNFHKDCINKLRKYDSAALCPNCRRPIRDTT